LAAIRTFFRFVALREPQCAQWVAQIMAIPVKRQARKLVGYLTREEIECLLAAPDRASWLGRRNHAMLLILYNTGARVSEIINLRQSQVSIGVHSFVHLHGKGRKERSIPLWKNTAQVLSSWIRENGAQDDSLVFPNARGTHLTRQGVNYILRKTVQQATENSPSLHQKHVSPHVLRHTTAMHLLQAGVDPAVIALWLGHENLQTTHVYVEADLQMKENALNRLAPIDANVRRYKADDSLMRFLSSL
jgi:site-specific recombinase XerD